MTTEEPRLKPDVWVAAYMRTVQAAGAFAYLARRGPEGVGSVLIKQVTGRQATIFTPAYMADGRRGWLRGTGPEPVSEQDADDYIQRALSRDPDIWVVEVEDLNGRHFLTEPVEGEQA